MIRLPRIRQIGSRPRRGASAGSLAYPGTNVLFLADWRSQFFSDSGFTVPCSADGDSVKQWTDRIGANHLVETATPNPTFKPTGTAAGRSAVDWDGSTQRPLWNSNGATIAPVGALSMTVVVKNSGASGRSGVCGRGGFANEGFTFQFNSSNDITGICRTSGGTSTLGSPSPIGDWTVAVMSFDGTDFFFQVRGAADQSTSIPGSLLFADDSFAAGGTASTAGASAFFGNGGKQIALIATSTVTYNSTTATPFLDRVARWCGL